MENKFYITTPIYYVNDKPHIGHAYTTIAADVLARYWRSKIGGENVFFLTGTDEHGAKVAESAKKAGLEPQEFCDMNSQLFKDAFKSLNISHDYFIRTTDKRHETAVKKFIQKLFDQGDIYEGAYEGLYCIGCEKFLTEKELVNGLCPLHNRLPEKVKEKNYFFRLKGKYLDEVRHRIERDEIKILPTARKSEVLGLFRQGMEDFSVSREKVEWGIPLPFDKKQNTYVWIDALLNYISAIGYGSDEKKLNTWWPADVQLMARDILKFHAVYWPALLLAAGLPTPKIIFAHGFFSINGQKMSKSLGNAIDPNDLVEKFGVDATRYLLLSQFPFGQDGDIKELKFIEQYNANLANGLGNLVSRVCNLIAQSDGLGSHTYQKVNIAERVGREIEQLNFQEALGIIFKQIADLDAEIATIKPWESAFDNPDRKLFLAQCANRILEIGGALQPFMPGTAKQIIERLSAEKITKGQPLFQRI